METLPHGAVFAEGFCWHRLFNYSTPVAQPFHSWVFTVRVFCTHGTGDMQEWNRAIFNSKMLEATTFMAKRINASIAMHSHNGIIYSTENDWNTEHLVGFQKYKSQKVHIQYHFINLKKQNQSPYYLRDSFRDKYFKLSGSGYLHDTDRPREQRKKVRQYKILSDSPGQHQVSSKHQLFCHK